MASFIAKKISTKILGETMENKWGVKVRYLTYTFPAVATYMLTSSQLQDPMFEHVPATRLDGKPSKKMKKVKRAIPPGISEHDAQILNKVKRRAYKLDLSLFSIAGVRFGWSSVIGIVPL